MRMLSLAVFAVLALVIGAYEESGMTILIGIVSALAAVASLPRWRLSTFLTMLSELFVVETVIFGVADIVALLGYWPKAYEEYQLPTYLPLATAIFILVIFGVSHFAVVRRMMRIADPFFAARTPISISPWPLPRMIARQDVYARINVWFLILINQFQVALGLRFNFFQRDFGNAIQVADEAHRTAFWHQLIYVFVPLAFIAILAGLVEFFVASNFVLQWRRWMTASFTSRWLTQSMHYKLALGASEADNPDQRISQDVGGFINGSGTGINSGNAGIYNYTIQAISSATNLVSFSIILWGISNAMRAPIFGVEIPGFLFWVAVLYAAVATGVTHLIGRSLSRLYFRQQTVEANFRFDLARIREYSEQIALLKGEDREIERAGNVFADVFHTIQRIIRVRTWLIAFNQFYSQISVIIPYVVVAPFYYLKVVDFGRFSQSADAFGAVNGVDELLRRPLHRARRFQRRHPASDHVRGVLRRAPRTTRREPRIRTVAADGPDPVAAGRRHRAAGRAQARPYRRPRARCRRNRRWSSAPRASASPPCSGPSPACGRSARARSGSRNTPS